MANTVNGAGNQQAAIEAYYRQLAEQAKAQAEAAEQQAQQAAKDLEAKQKASKDATAAAGVRPAAPQYAAKYWQDQMDAVKPPDQVVALATQVPSPEVEASLRNLKASDCLVVGKPADPAAVTWVQNFLIAKGIPGVTANGVYDQATADAVMAYQQQQVDGGKQSWYAEGNPTGMRPPDAGGSSFNGVDGKVGPGTLSWMLDGEVLPAKAKVDEYQADVAIMQPKRQAALDQAAAADAAVPATQATSATVGPTPKQPIISPLISPPNPNTQDAGFIQKQNILAATGTLANKDNFTIAMAWLTGLAAEGKTDKQNISLDDLQAKANAVINSGSAPYTYLEKKDSRSDGYGTGSTPVPDEIVAAVRTLASTPKETLNALGICAGGKLQTSDLNRINKLMNTDANTGSLANANKYRTIIANNYDLLASLYSNDGSSLKFEAFQTALEHFETGDGRSLADSNGLDLLTKENNPDLYAALQFFTKPDNRVYFDVMDQAKNGSFDAKIGKKDVQSDIQAVSPAVSVTIFKSSYIRG